jgi:hypothetical protein
MRGLCISIWAVCQAINISNKWEYKHAFKLHVIKQMRSKDAAKLQWLSKQDLDHRVQRVQIAGFRSRAEARFGLQLRSRAVPSDHWVAELWLVNLVLPEWLLCTAGSRNGVCQPLIGSCNAPPPGLVGLLLVQASRTAVARSRSPPGMYIYRPSYHHNQPLLNINALYTRVPACLPISFFCLLIFYLF